MLVDHGCSSINCVEPVHTGLHLARVPTAVIAFEIVTSIRFDPCIEDLYDIKELQSPIGREPRVEDTSSLSISLILTYTETNHVNEQLTC